MIRNTSPLLILCGLNFCDQLGEKSNNESIDGEMIICPPKESHLDTSTILSYSIYEYSAVAITKNGEFLANGENSDGRIIGSLSNICLNDFTKFEIKDEKGHTLQPISSVCCLDFTLYLVASFEDNKKKRLVFSYDGIGTANPLFLNIGDSNPVSLFGGFSNAAVIDEKGAVIFIPFSSRTRNSKSPQLESTSLPDGDEAVSVACCEYCILAVGLSGRVFESRIQDKGNKLNFVIVESLQDKKIIEVSGSSQHCFAVTEDGCVFGRGSNEAGELGIGKGTEKVTKFREISSLNRYKIKHAYAGFDHSLFQTNEGKILACGRNECGQLLGRDPSDECVYLPRETTVTKDATFCVAGNGISAVFIGHEPLNSPNRRSDLKKMAITPIEQPKPSNNNIINQQTQNEISFLRSQLEKEKKKNNDLMKFLHFTSHRPNSSTKSRSINIIDDDIESRYHINIGKISDGSTSISYKIIDSRTMAPICKKVLKYKCNQVTIKDAQIALKEYQIINNVSHPCICRIIGISTSEPIESKNKKVKMTSIAMFFEFAEYKLVDVLKKSINNTLKARIALDVAHAMNFLHKSGLIHRELKIENIMLNSFLETKLIGLGFVRINELLVNNFSYVKDSLAKGIGSFAFMSPEMANEEEYDSKTDVYSFGVILHVIFAGNLPNQSLNEKMSGKKFKLPNPSDSISPFCINLIEQCTVRSPLKRPSFDNILNQLRENSFELASDIDPSILLKRDKELEFIENYE